MGVFARKAHTRYIENISELTTASGLIAIPDFGAGKPGKLPVVSYQHGTVYANDEVPSDPEQSVETRLMLAQFASQGYVMIGAGYFGRGQSPETDSYLRGNFVYAVADQKQWFDELL